MNLTRALWLSAAVALALGCTRKSEPLLIDRVEQRLKADHPGFPVKRVDARTLEVDIGPGDAAMTLSLDNLTLRCAKQPDDCEDSIAAISRSLGEQAQALHQPEKRSDILLTLHDAEWVHRVQQTMANAPVEAREDSALLVEPLIADLSVVYVLDHPNGMEMLNVGRLKTMKLARDEVPRLARKNLLALAPHIQWLKVDEGMWTNARGDNYDSAYLAVPGSWKELADEHGGKLIVSAPARNRVFAISDPAQLPALREATEKAFKEDDHALSRVLLDWSPDGWHVHAAR